jgi:arsenate reductase
VCDLTSVFALSQPTVSHHLRVLRDAGLVEAERRGTWAYYRLVPEAIERLHDVFAAPALAGVALVELRSAGGIAVHSAGSAPADEIHPAVAEAMHEVGVDLSGASPKVLTDNAVQRVDVVVTMGCGDACPVYPGKRYEDWTVDDPAGQDLATVRRIREEIDVRVRALVAELVD